MPWARGTTQIHWKGSLNAAVKYREAACIRGDVRARCAAAAGGREPREECVRVKAAGGEADRLAGPASAQSLEHGPFKRHS